MPAVAQHYDQDPEQIEVGFYRTDPRQRITVAVDRHIKDNKPTPLTTTYEDWFETLSRPDTDIMTKDGPGYMNGPCNGLRRKVNVPYYDIVVIDGDASLDEIGNKIEGAPSPLAVHTALTDMDISHHVYTTYSHGSKGNRWRLLVPVRVESQAQLRAVVTYIISLLSAQAKLPVYLTQESVSWGNRWHMPRTAYENAPFYAATHFGHVPDPATLSRYYGQIDRTGNEVREDIPEPKSRSANGLIAQFCHYYPLPEMLTANGYQFSHQSVVVDLMDREMPVLRYTKPGGSSNSAGVVVFWDANSERWRGYSHHTNDVMSTGKSFDSFDVLQHLGGYAEETDWIMLAAEQIRQAVLEEMSTLHPVVMDNGKYRIGYLLSREEGSGNEYKFMQQTDFNHLMSNQPGVFMQIRLKDGTTGLKSVDRATWWKSCTERKSYNGLVFRPTRLGEPFDRDLVVGSTRYFNLFNGWGITPEDGRCDKIDWHLRNVLCGGNEVEYEYLMDWLAHMFQFPDEKPGVALVLRSGKGTGKSLFMSKLCQALGPLGIVIANARQLTGDFNSHMRNKLLGLVEESFWAGSHAEEGPLKHLITDELTTFERKGQEAESGRSFIRLVLCTNSQWAAPASADERRFAFLSVSDAGKTENQLTGRYFSDLASELTGGGINALAKRLLNRRIDKEALRTPPQTENLVKQKLLSFTGLNAWLYDAIKLGGFKVSKTGMEEVLRPYPHTNRVSMEFLTESAGEYLTRHDSSRSVQIRVEMVIQDLIGRMGKETAGGKLMVVLPGLEQMREAFDAYIGHPIPWEVHNE